MFCSKGKFKVWLTTGALLVASASPLVPQGFPKALAGWGPDQMDYPGVVLGGVEEITAAEVEKVFRTNVFGLLNVTRAVLPQMRRQHSGHIINISSVGGYQSHAGWGIGNHHTSTGRAGARASRR